MNEEPATSVDKESAIRSGVVAVALLELGDFELAGREEVHPRGHRHVAERHITVRRSDVDILEAAEVFEQGAVWRSHSELHLGQSGQCAEEAHVVLLHECGLLQVMALLGELSEHIDLTY